MVSVIHKVALASLAILWSGNVAQSCAALNEAVIQIEEFNIGYSSWVVIPVEGQQLYKYSRCVRSLNGNWFDFDWEGAGLKGRVEADQPAFVQYVFFREVTQMAQAELKFGRSKPLENKIVAGFLKNEAEVGGFAMVDAYLDELVSLNAAAMEAGTQLDPNLTSIDTNVSLVIPISEELGARLKVSFSSSIPAFIGNSESQYILTYTFDPSQVSVGTIVSLEPRSQLLKDVFLKSRDSAILSPTDQEQVWNLSFPFELSASTPLTAFQDIVDVKVGQEIVASFPVTLYAPRLG